MNIAVFGLGYVGSVTAACLAARGHRVTGVDLDASRVQAINGGGSPVLEPGLDQLIRTASRSGALRATTDTEEALEDSHLSLVCVGTPSGAAGMPDLSQVERVTCQIGEALRDAGDEHIVVYRSTMLPGTIEERLIPALTSAAHRTPGETLAVAVNPEFLREGSGISDFHNPSRILIGASDRAIAERVARLFDGIEAPRVLTSIRIAELVKYADNSFHALKVAYANEMGRVCKASGIDARALMEIFCLDRQLNLSDNYLMPANAFGGSCLPKDVRALVHHARHQGVEIPLIEALLRSNSAHKQRALELIQGTGARRVGMLGLSFKPGTDDLRESPGVELALALIEAGYDLTLYDPSVSVGRLTGSNKAFIEREIPHLARLMSDSLDGACASADVIVVTRPDPLFARALECVRPSQYIVDLAGITGTARPPQNYVGICW